MARNLIHLGDNLPFLRTLAAGSIPLVYIDPPFNTGRRRHYRRLRTARADGEEADRVGFGGRAYRSVEVSRSSYPDAFDDYLAFLEPRLVEARRVLADDGSIYVHLDQREVHRVRGLLDAIFGPEAFLNEIVWAYDFGGRPRDRWPAKHDTILFYARTPGRHHFSRDGVDRLPYLAPGLVGPEKASRGKLPTDVWWQTVVGTNARERTGYPTQKPLAILRRIVAASSRPGDVVLDFFAGSGTTGAAALELGRDFVLVDDNPAAVELMARRLAEAPGLRVERGAPGDDPAAGDGGRVR